MGKKDGKPGSGSGKTEPRSIFQPVAVALVCVVLIILLAFIGMINLKGLHDSLVGYMETRGLHLIRDVEQSSEYYLKRLMQSGPSGIDTEFKPVFSESLSLQEAMVIDLIEIARKIDLYQGTEPLTDEEVGSIARAEEIRLIAVVDSAGVVKANGFVDGHLLGLAEPVVKGHEKIVVDLFGPAAFLRDTGALILKREGRQGAVILGLDREGIRYRSVMVAFQAAIEDIVRESETAYFAVMDQNRKIIAGIGDFSGIERVDNPATEPEKITRRGISSEGEHMLEISAPIGLGPGAHGRAVVAFSRESSNRILEKIRSVLFASMVVVVFITLLSMFFLYRSQKRHLKGMREMERRLQQAERLSAMGRLAAGVAHEIRNPLNAISMATQRLQREHKEELMGVIKEEIKRLNLIIEEFLQFSRTDRLNFLNQDISAIVNQIILLVQDEAEAKGVKTDRFIPDSPIMAPVDKDKLKQALLNVAKNALEATGDGGSIRFSLREKDRHWVSIKISDTGEGIPEDRISRIFDPDYTTKEKGLGLGLPIANEIIRGHGGEIEVLSLPDSGTTFEILLPKLI